MLGSEQLAACMLISQHDKTRAVSSHALKLNKCSSLNILDLHIILFLFTYHIRFILNQIWSTWTKFIEKIFINQTCPARNRPGKWMRLISYSFYIYCMLYYVCSKLNLTNFDQIYIKNIYIPNLFLLIHDEISSRFTQLANRYFWLVI